MTDLEIYNKIKSLESLKPSTETNLLFSSLVSFCIDDSNNISLNQKEVKGLQSLCSKAEEELELDFCLKVLKNEKKLQDFLYYDNCYKQTILEYSNILNFKKDIKKCVFVGGGPLPLTAILLAQNFGLSVTVLEKKEEYAKLSSELIQQLDLENKIEIITQDGLVFEDYKSFDLIIVAALVKSATLEKEEIANVIAKQNLTLIRYAENNKVLLYENINKKKINNLKLSITPHSDIINSFLVINP